MAQKGDKTVRVDARGLCVARGDRILLTGIDCALGPGDAMLLTGANGIGKSSLLRVLGGLLPRFSGELEIMGAIAIADGKSALDAQSGLADALRFWATIDHGRANARGQVTAALAAMGLSDLADIPVHMLSTGQTRRAALARLLVRDADIWLLDEPANGLDSESVDRLGTAMAAHRACGGIVIAASHQPLPLDGAIKMALTDYRAKELAE